MTDIHLTVESLFPEKFDDLERLIRSGDQKLVEVWFRSISIELIGEFLLTTTSDRHTPGCLDRYGLREPILRRLRSVGFVHRSEEETRRILEDPYSISPSLFSAYRLQGEFSSVFQQFLLDCHRLATIHSSPDPVGTINSEGFLTDFHDVRCVRDGTPEELAVLLRNRKISPDLLEKMFWLVLCPGFGQRKNYLVLPVLRVLAEATQVPVGPIGIFDRPIQTLSKKLHPRHRIDDQGEVLEYLLRLREQRNS